ncbi:MAG: DUF1254 domain-containing protein [Sphingomonas sp.]|uniref:DUF1254 domain-containing protein n=1 Tax=Sphingomonas sp. TaxID=28214 RepID=UPI0025F48462|nr:DUF1254 domain-containing protein [Sphingomonas sp.]MBX3564503.1 DUF1254 domain-containing protein [Sphingomonas sp.]
MIRRWGLPLLIGIVAALVAWQAALIATPRILMVLAVSRIEKVGGPNHFTHAPLADDRSRAIVRPSPDLAYSSCPFDLSKGPLRIDAVPVTTAPYWSLSIFDAQTDAVFVRNATESATPFRVAIVAPGQTAPAGYMPVHVLGPRGIALVRILIDEKARFAEIDAARRETNCAV